MQDLKIGLIDLGNTNPQDYLCGAIENVIEYAVAADQLGFSRFWFGEHYSFGLPWNSPETLLPVAAGLTSRIKIGVAGVVITLHSAYRIASHYKLLANLFPGRIDLGLAKGFTSEEMARYLLLKEDFAHQESLTEAKTRRIVELYATEEALFEEDFIIPPFKGTVPEIWKLGTSYNNMDSSLTLGTSFCRSIFHNIPEEQFVPHKEKLLAYREKYFEKYHTPPNTNLALAGICHKTTAQANTVLASYKNCKKALPVSNKSVIGCPNYFYDTIMQYRQDYGVDEIIFHNLAVDQSEKLESLELLSDLFSLEY